MNVFNRDMSFVEHSEEEEEELLDEEELDGAAIGTTFCPGFNVHSNVRTELFERRCSYVRTALFICSNTQGPV